MTMVTLVGMGGHWSLVNGDAVADRQRGTWARSTSLMNPYSQLCTYIQYLDT